MAIEDEHYKFITSQISARDMAAVSYVKMYIQFFTTLVAGSVWLRTHIGHPNKLLLGRLTALSDTIAIVSAILTIALVYDGLRSWHGYRKAQVIIACDYRKFAVPPPKWSAARYMEVSVGFTVFATLVAFIICNPFRKDGNFLSVPSRSDVSMSDVPACARGDREADLPAAVERH